ncbi:MAG: LytTR family transcriptional regulator DNA-binding domain-containing protein [Clostridia bacterium]|nr:LytTR family transcriptional regulator DNA-binding domain-containing protein [Clostridia bacterium]
MNFKFFIDKSREEEVIVYAHEKNEIVKEIESIVQQSNSDLFGYTETEAKKLNLFDVNCFITENNKTYALTDEKLQIKKRLYEIEAMVDDGFIKINQSCIANIRQIEKVQSTFSGSLSVIFKNGYKDYISRRNLKSVKERLGVKL